MRQHRVTKVCALLVLSSGCGSCATAAPRQQNAEATAVTTSYSPTVISVHRSEVAPSAMQEISGTLSVRGTCLVLLSGKPTKPVLPIWIRPARFIRAEERIGVEQRSDRVFVGEHVRLSGTGGGAVSAAFAAAKLVPASCRGLPTFIVNGILGE